MTREERNWTNVTKQEFQAYEGVRASGVTNMWAVDLVCELSGLKMDECIEIMKHYTELDARYPDVRKAE